MRWVARHPTAAVEPFQRICLPTLGWLDGVMSLFSFAAILTVIAFAGTAWQIVAADEPPPTATIRASHPLPMIAEPSLDEIARIRQSVGAVIPSIANNDNLFVDALRRVAQPSNPVIADNPVTTDIQAIADSQLTADSRATADKDDDDNDEKPLAIVQLTIASLRNSARELDLQAYEFDEQQKRAESKRLRRLAQSLRREAEQLEDSELKNSDLEAEQLQGEQLGSRRPSAGRSTLVTPMDTRR